MGDMMTTISRPASLRQVNRAPNAPDSNRKAIALATAASVGFTLGEAVFLAGAFLVAGFLVTVFFAAWAGVAAMSERTADTARKSRRFNRFSRMRLMV